MHSIQTNRLGHAVLRRCKESKARHSLFCLESVETVKRCTVSACTKPKPSAFPEVYPALNVETVSLLLNCRCGNVAAILELDEHLKREFTIFEAAPQVRIGFYKGGYFYGEFSVGQKKIRERHI